MTIWGRNKQRTPTVCAQYTHALRTQIYAPLLVRISTQMTYTATTGTPTTQPLDPLRPLIAAQQLPQWQLCLLTL